MAKGNSKGSDRAKREQKSKNRADAVSAASAEDSSKMPRRYRKQLRILERALADAARLESRRLLKLERARYRRQMIEAVLEELRPEMAAPEAGAAAAKPDAAAAKPVVTPAAASKATAARAVRTAPKTPEVRPAAKPKAARQAATAQTATPRPAATRRTAPTPATPAKPAPASEPTEPPAAPPTTDKA